MTWIKDRSRIKITQISAMLLHQDLTIWGNFHVKDSLRKWFCNFRRNRNDANGNRIFGSHRFWNGTYFLYIIPLLKYGSVWWRNNFKIPVKSDLLWWVPLKPSSCSNGSVGYLLQLSVNTWVVGGSIWTQHLIFVCQRKNAKLFLFVCLFLFFFVLFCFFLSLSMELSNFKLRFVGGKKNLIDLAD